MALFLVRPEGGGGTTNPANVSRQITHSSGSLTIDATLGHIIEVTLGGNVSLHTFTNIAPDDTITLYYKASGGSRQIVLTGATPIFGLTSPDIVNLSNGDIYKTTWINVFGTTYLKEANPIGSVTTAPAAPVITGISGNSQATINWTTPSNGGSPITDYTLEWSTNSFSSVAGTITPGAGATSHIVSTLTNGTTYQFRLRANNAIGSSSNSNVLSLTPVAGLSVSLAGFISNSSSTPVVPNGNTIVVCSISQAGATGTYTIGAPGTGWTEIGTEFNHVSGFRSDHRWFRKSGSGVAETLNGTSANTHIYWIISANLTSFVRGGNDEAYQSSGSGGNINIVSVTAPTAGIHLITVAATSDNGPTNGTVTLPAGYTTAANTTPNFHAVRAGHKNISSGPTGILTATVDNLANWSTTSVAVS